MNATVEQPRFRLEHLAPELVEALQAVFDDCADVDNDSCLTLETGEKVVRVLAKAKEAV